LKLLKYVYTNIETNIDVFKEEEFSRSGLIESPRDVHDDEDMMCIFVVSALLSVPPLGVMQAVNRRQKETGTTDALRQDKDLVTAEASRMPWCVSTSRTAISCCRLFDCLKSAHETYTIEVYGAASPRSCSQRSDSESCNLIDISSLTPWDLKMVLLHRLYLPRVSYEYSGLKHPVEPIRSLDETDFSELYVDKAYRGMFQMTLCDSNVYSKLRGIRELIYRNLNIGVDSGGGNITQIIEILRQGRLLEVVPVTCHSEIEGSKTCFFRDILQEPLSIFTQDRCRFRLTEIPGCCGACKHLIYVRCLQFRTLVKLLGVVFANDNDDENTPSYNCYSFQLSVVLLAGRHLCHELIALPCGCLETCDFFEKASLFNNISAAYNASRVLTEFQLTNLWTAVEVSVLHCDYLMFCCWKKTSQHDFACLSPEERQDSADKYSKLAREMIFPFGCLSPSYFAGIHREVVSSCKSIDYSSFVASCCAEDCQDKLSEKTAKTVFQYFVEVAMSPELTAEQRL
jgi:hypothetical protein